MPNIKDNKNDNKDKSGGDRSQRDNTANGNSNTKSVKALLSHPKLVRQPVYKYFLYYIIFNNFF